MQYNLNLGMRMKSYRNSAVGALLVKGVPVTTITYRSPILTFVRYLTFSSIILNICAFLNDYKISEISQIRLS